jgi:tRNA-(ms[2]io[6]A)-hydroxylase
MLGLKLPTDPRWVNIVEKNIHEILTDHAFCEQKAASTAISLIIRYPEESELVKAMTDLAQEELSHFQMVHQLILERGWVLGRERKDKYVRDIQKFFPKGGSRIDQLVHQLLYAALIEARSCERFRLLSESIADQALQKFYRKLMISEAHHYSLFLKLARQYGENEKTVNEKWEDLLEYESQLMTQLGKKETIHG